MEPGDTVCILFGSGLAFVPRKFEPMSNAIVYTVVGSTYEYSIMEVGQSILLTSAVDQFREKGDFIEELEHAGMLEERKEMVHLA
jgi:hypothetical protein